MDELLPSGQEKLIPRDEPQVTQSRKKLVTSIASMVKRAKTHWERQFHQMERDQRFCSGEQWGEERKSSYFNDIEDKYMANITLRHVQQRVAALYAKNPKAVARRRKRLLNTVWDGQMASLQAAQGLVQSAMQAQQQMMAGPQIDPMSGMPMPPPPMPDPNAVQQAQEVIQDAGNVKQQIDQLTKIAETLELLYQYEVDSQQVPFKTAMKMVIRRAATSGVGYIKVGFQRTMGKNPDFDTHLADLEQRLSVIERISADIADGETPEDSAEAEQLKLAIQDLMNEQEIVLREGLQFSYPKSTAIIPDPRCTHLREFLGADWVAEEYLLSVNEVKEVYGVDVGKNYTSYERMDIGTDYEHARALWNRYRSNVDNAEDNISSGDGDTCVVWEVYSKKDGMVYVVCDGYHEFLREPSSPDPWIERFWPWFPVIFNETDGKVFPPSDVSLIRPMQLELNRSRQMLRELRWASRPKLVYAEGLLSPDDLDALRTHPMNAVIAVSGLQPQQAIDQVLQPLRGFEFNPAMYETNAVFQDMLKVSGDQEANLGGTAEATATETQVAQQSRATALGSAVDDLDETLSAIARASGEILLLNVQEQTVKEIVGEGAIWPSLTRADVAKNVWLEIEAGSSGKPDQALSVSNFERLSPILMSIPGIQPMWLAKEAIKRLDDKIDLEQALSDGAPSIMMQNGAKGVPGGPGGPSPQGNMQGPAGSNNAPAPPSPQSDAPTPRNFSPQDKPSEPGMPM